MKIHLLGSLLWCLFICAGGAADDIVAAAKMGDLETVKLLLSQDATQVRHTDSQGYTALHWASIRAHWDVVRLLLTSNPNVNAVGADGGTPLHWACHHDQPDIVEQMIDQGANPDAQNQWGRAPLHVAVRRGCKQVVDLLLTRGADPRTTTKEGWTPLHVAYRSGHRDVIDLLLSKGLSTKTKDSDGRIPSEHEFIRPEPIPPNSSRHQDYVGEYFVEGEFSFKVWEENGRLYMMDFAPDEIYAIAEDVFFCRQEPWRVTFTRDEAGKVNEVEVEFIRRKVKGRRRAVE